MACLMKFGALPPAANLISRRRQKRLPFARRSLNIKRSSTCTELALFETGLLEASAHCAPRIRQVPSRLVLRAARLQWTAEAKGALASFNGEASGHFLFPKMNRRHSGH